MFRKGIIAASVLAALLTTAAVTTFYTSAESAEPAAAKTVQAPPAIRVAAAERRELVATLPVTGTIVAREEAFAGTDRRARGAEEEHRAADLQDRSTGSSGWSCAGAGRYAWRRRVGRRTAVPHRHRRRTRTGRAGARNCAAGRFAGHAGERVPGWAQSAGFRSATSPAARSRRRATRPWPCRARR